MLKVLKIFTLSIIAFSIHFNSYCINITPKKVAFVYSYDENNSSYINLQPEILKQFKYNNLPIQALTYFLNCEVYNAEKEIEVINDILNSISEHSPDLIILIGDQASYSAMVSNNPILKSTPVILLSVKFLNRDLFKLFNNHRVYCLGETPDFYKNIKFIEQLMGEKVNIEMNFDFTSLGKSSFRELNKQIDTTKWEIIFYLYQHPDYFVNGENEFNEIGKRYYDTYMSYQLDSNRQRKNKLSSEETKIYMFPYRYIQGYHIFNHFLYDNENIFLLDKMDISSEIICLFSQNPTFSCIREVFNNGTTVVGGYLSTSRIVARECVSLSIDIFSNKTNIPKYSELSKEYVLDWDIFKKFDKLDKSRIPKDIYIINRLFYEKYLAFIISVGVLFVILLVFAIIYLITISRENKIQKINLQLLKAGHNKLSIAIRGSDSATWSYENGTIYFDNNVAEISSEFEQEMSFDQLKAFVHPDDTNILNILKVNLTSKNHSENTEFKNQIRFYSQKDCGYIWTEFRYCFIHNKNKNDIIAGLIMNVQEAKEREEELIKARNFAEKAELKQSFLANMSHEIRTPLNSIVGFSNLLSSNESFSFEEKQIFTKNINDNKDLLLAIINEVIEISKIESKHAPFNYEEIEINTFIKECYDRNILLINKDLEFRIHTLNNSDNISFFSDKTRLIQVVSNLIENSNKFTKNGFIEIGCQWDEVNEEIIIYVEDSGKGIPEDQYKIIFNRFYKIDPFSQGTGLGLSLCDAIVKELNGRIELESTLNVGSKFKIILNA